MLGRIVLCAGCLVAQGFTPAVFLTGLSQTTVSRRQQQLSLKTGGLFHAEGGSSSSSGGGSRGSPSLAHALNPRRSKIPPGCHRSGEAAEEESHVSGSKLPRVTAPETPRDGVPVGPCTSATTATTSSKAPGCTKEAGGLLPHTAATHRQQLVSPARSVQTLLVGAALACSLLLTSTVATTSPAHADSSQHQEHQQHQEPRQLMFGLVEPRPPFPGRVRPPPPEIPEGRITIAQWCEKNIGRRLPKVGDVTAGIKTAADNAEKIRINSGSAPTAQELRGMAGQAVEGKLDGFFPAGRRESPKTELLTSASSSSESPSLSLSSSEGLQEAEASTGIATTPSPLSQDLSLRQEIDALKAEMLNLQSTAPPAEPTKPATSDIPSGAPSSAVETPGSRRFSPSFFKVEKPRSFQGWSCKLGVPPATTRGAVDAEKIALSADAQARSGVVTSGRPPAEEAEALPSPPPRNKPKKREKPRRSDAVSSPAASTLLDLKAQLRAESERAAANAPPPSSPVRRPQREGSDEAAASRAAAMSAKYVEPAPLYEPPSESALSTATAPRKELLGGVIGGTAGGGRGENGVGTEAGGGRGEGVGLEGITAAARSSLEKLEVGGLSEKVKELADKGGSASGAGVAAVLEQGRATVDRLQAEAERISTDALSTAAAPIAEKLSTLPEAGRSAGQAAGSRASELSARAAAELSSSAARLGRSVKHGAEGAAAAGGAAATAATGRLSEALGRGAADVLAPVVGEAGRAVRDGVSALSRSGADGIPALKGQVAALTSQVVETSNQALSQATGGAGDISQSVLRAISGGLPGVDDLRGLDFAASAKSALGQLPSLARAFASGALTVAEGVFSVLRQLAGGSIFADGRGRSDATVQTTTVALGAVVAWGAATFGRSGNGDGGGGGGGGDAGVIGDGRGRKGSRGNAGGEAARGDAERRLQPMGGAVAGAGAAPEREERLLQPVGVKLETGAAPSEGVRYGREAVSATSTLWDMIRDSGTGAGDSVREVSEEDLLERAAQVGEKLRETAEGLQVLRHEVLALRESIRESDLEGRAKAIRERLAATLEGSVAD